MVDAWTQWTLYPLHSYLFWILSRIPTDGTFAQLEPLKRIPWGKVPLYSYDLSAATDRLPIWLQTKIISYLLGGSFAFHWENLLVNRDYKIGLHPHCNFSVPKGTPKSVRYAVGQPMGALSSWAMLALTHHYIVQFSAWKAGLPRSQWFSKYAVLGDDIVIWDKSVAKAYLETMKALGVEIGLAKSVVSPLGKGLEFAKRTIVEGVDVSPVPFKEQSAAHQSMASFLQFSAKYSLTPLQSLRYLGFGYKVDQTKTNNRMVRAMNLVQTIPKDSKEFLSLFVSEWSFLSPSSLPLLKKTLVDVVSGELTRLGKFCDELYYELIVTDAARYSLSRGPGSTQEKKVSFSVSERELSILIRDLQELRQGLKFWKASISADVDFFNPRPLKLMGATYPPLALWKDPLESSGRLKPFPITYFSIISFIMESNKLLDRVQANSILHPERSLYSQTLTFVEHKRTIQMWNRWLLLLNKVSKTLF